MLKEAPQLFSIQRFSETLLYQFQKPTRKLNTRCKHIRFMQTF